MKDSVLNEENVVDAVCGYFGRRGLIVTQKLRTTQRGTDIIAERQRDGRKILVEAKGDTSTRPGTSRHGKPFTASQIRTHTGVALLKAAELLQLNGRARTTVCIAVPDSDRQRRVFRGIDGCLRQLGVTLLLVDPASMKVSARPSI